MSVVGCAIGSWTRRSWCCWAGIRSSCQMRDGIVSCSDALSNFIYYMTDVGEMIILSH